MKVALCLSGLTRSIEKGYQSYIDYLIKPYNADVFIHTWDMNVEGRFANAPVFKTVSKEEILNKLTPKKLEIENYSQWYRNTQKYAHNNIDAMYYSIYKADMFCSQYEYTNDFKYDLIIRNRMDALHNESLPLNEIEEALKTDTVFVRFCGTNKGGYTNRQNFDYYGMPFVADNFAFGGNKAMTIYGSTYTQIKNIYKSGTPPESILGINLQLNKVAYKWSNIKFMSLVHWDQNCCVYESDYEQKIQKLL